MKKIFNCIFIGSLCCGWFSSCGPNNPEEVPGAIDSIGTYTPDKTQVRDVDSSLLIKDSTDTNNLHR